MLVRILKPTPYTPTRDDSPRCCGQLRLRSTKVKETVTVEVDGAEAVVTEREVCGPMELYFKAGSRPELPDEFAAQLIAAGAAERLDQSAVARFVDYNTIKDGPPQ